MVSCVAVKCPDLVLPVVNQPNGQVFVSQCDIIAKEVDPRDCTDKLPTAGIVVIPLIQQDAVKSYWYPFFWITLCHSNREGGSGCAATATATWSSWLACVTQLPFLSGFARHTWWSTQPLKSSRSCFANNSIATFHTWLSRIARSPGIPWLREKNTVS